MKALVFGMGMQGKAVVHDLEQNPLVTEIIAADVKAEPVQTYLEAKGYRKARAVSLNASVEGEMEACIRAVRPDVVVSMLPTTLKVVSAKAAVTEGVHYVSSSYTDEVAELDAEAKKRGVVVLPEMGLDPGIDLVLGRLAIEELDEVEGFYSYGGGVPEPACADDNPLKYKVTWTLDGVLKAYKRPSVLIRDGQVVNIPGTQIFYPENCHTMTIPEVGELDAYPNGDAVRFRELYQLGADLKEMGRFAVRYPGHCAIWRTLVDLGFLEDTPVSESVPVTPHKFLVDHLTPRLQLESDQRDVVVLRALAWGRKGAEKRIVKYDLVDYRDLETGLYAMNRTVGFTAAIGAQLILDGTIRTAGVLSPIRDVPPDRLLSELKQRNIQVIRRVEFSENI